MAGAALVQGKTAIQAVIKALVSHVVISDDATAFVKTQTGINPGSNKSTFAKAATKVDVTVTDTNDAFDSIITVTGTTDFTGKVINCIGVGKGTGLRQSSNGTGTDGGGTGVATSIGTDLISRSVRAAGLGIGVQAGDIFTIGVRGVVEDNSP